MKKLLAILTVLAFLFVAGTVSADWVNDLPVPTGVISISVKFKEDKGIVTLKTVDDSCMEYYIVDNEIAKMRKCGDADWSDFTKKGVKGND